MYVCIYKCIYIHTHTHTHTHTNAHMYMYMYMYKEHLDHGVVLEVSAHEPYT
jgi:hypothetical protein